MNRLMKFTGGIVWVGIICTILYRLFSNIDFFSTVLKIIGAFTLLGISVYFLLKILFGDKWITKTGKVVIIGSDLSSAIELFMGQLPKPDKEVTSNLFAHLVYRFTRIGIIGLMIGLIPLLLLWQQNRLLQTQNDKIENQNELFRFQNERVDAQTELLKEQNEVIVIQNRLLNSQNNLTEEQNLSLNKQTELFEFQTTELSAQTTLLRSQNRKIDSQNDLSESSRRSSLVLMMSNN